MELNELRNFCPLLIKLSFRDNDKKCPLFLHSVKPSIYGSSDKLVLELKKWRFSVP